MAFSSGRREVPSDTRSRLHNKNASVQVTTAFPSSTGASHEYSVTEFTTFSSTTSSSVSTTATASPKPEPRVYDSIEEADLLHGDELDDDDEELDEEEEDEEEVDESDDEEAEKHEMAFREEKADPLTGK